MRDLDIADKILNNKCKHCGHHEDEHWGIGPNGKHCQSLVGGGFRTSPKKCDCIGFNIKLK